ncbi:ArsR family transcriptional regulator [Streptomyces sp. NPDC015131]|uniref:ArsR family transcriptional regulator n=1 Tax=Streptomyces sp. NPDC015131 TaxID=3364941 RepID=UPI0036FA3195
MLRIHFTADDLALVRFAPRPSPLPELHAALMALAAPGADLLTGQWRARLLRGLPRAAGPLADLVPDGTPPAFLDVLGDTLDEGLALIAEARPEAVRSGIERVYARRPAPPWIRALHGGEAGALRTLERAQRAAHAHVLAPVWPLVQDLHRAEFTRHALAVAERGVGAALTGLVPGSRLAGGVWEWPAPDGTGRADGAGATDGTGRAGGTGGVAGQGRADGTGGPGAAGVREIRLGGRGLVLRPTFHWRHGPLVQDLPGRPVALALPVGRGVPPVPDQDPGAGGEPLAGVLGRTRLALLRSLDEGGATTTGLARRLGVGAATASAHASALRAAGLLTTTRAGRSVRHAPTPLALLLLGGGPAGEGRADDRGAAVGETF